MPVHLLDTAESLERFRPPAEAGGSPFDGLGLARAYFRSAPEEVSPFVIAVTDPDEQLLGHAAWCLARDRHGLTQLTGVGGADAWFHDPWIGRRESAGEVCAALASTLAATRGRWDYSALMLRQASGQPLVAALGAVGPVRQVPLPWRQHRVIAIAPGACRPGGRSQRRQRKHLEAVPHGFAAVDRYEVPDLLRWIAALQVARWPEVRDWAPYHAYMGLVCREALAADRLLAYRLAIEGRLAAAVVCARQGDMAYGLFQVYDPAFADYTPGALLISWALEQMAAAGIRAVDTGPGDYPYKARLATDVTPTAETFVAGSWRGRLLVAMRAGIWPVLREQESLRAIGRVLRPAAPRLHPT